MALEKRSPSLAHSLTHTCTDTREIATTCTRIPYKYLDRNSQNSTHGRSKMKNEQRNFGPFKQYVRFNMILLRYFIFRV